MEIQGYHGTSSSAKESIAKNGFDPARTHYRKDHWLGQGVYFFVDPTQAHWWANTISARIAGSYPVIYRVRISAPDEKVLNLNDNEQVALFFERIQEVYTAILGEGAQPEFTPETIRAVFFDYYKETYGISVILNTFQKPSVRYAGAFQSGQRLRRQELLSRQLGVSFKETQVCVSEKSCITQTELIYDGEDEVI